MKIIHLAAVVLVTMILSGCYSTVTHYDKDGKITKVEKVTNTSRMFDGTNRKSQMLMIDGTYLKSDISMTAGDTYTPGWTITYANGKAAVINTKDKAQVDKLDDVVGTFFTGIQMTKEGLKTGSGNSAVAVK
jgi:outer membrane murein-binding lipoprotein Lpp